MNKRRRYQAKRRRLARFRLGRMHAILWDGRWPSPYHLLLLTNEGRE